MAAAPATARVSAPRAFIPSVQQQAVFDWIDNGRGNAVVEAVAGSGKTTTLVEAMKRMSGSVAMVAYNKKIADEISERLKQLNVKHARASTFHSAGFSAWRRVAPGVVVDDKKVFKILDAAKVDEKYIPVAARLVSLGKQHAIGFLTLLDDKATWNHLIEHHSIEDELPEDGEGMTVEKLIDTAISALRASNAQLKQTIDFDDMLYAPLIENARMWQNDWVLVDEAQDTNPARRALVKKMLKPGGRLIAVGDRHQAIYGFTGADNDALDLIRKEFSATELPLTVTYRCPQAVVEVAREYVSHIQAHPSAPQGAVQYILLEDFEQLKGAPKKGDAVLCRNTKPLIQLAYSLLRRRIPCHVEGRDIGKGLLALVGRWKRVKTAIELGAKLEDYASVQVQRAMSKGQETQAQSISDRVDTLLFIINEILPHDALVADVKSELNRLFDDSAPGDARDVTLSTIHKSKGREWSTVYWWGANRFQPSPFARQQWQQEQETNLMYVAATRSKGTLINVEVPFKKKGE